MYERVTKKVYNAHMYLSKEKSKVTKQQSVSSKKPESQVPKVPQPQAPLSPIVYPTVYSPLSRSRGSSGVTDKKDAQSFDLEKKLKNLDFLEQTVSPTPVHYVPQAPHI